jgi:hypothetical protein
MKKLLFPVLAAMLCFVACEEMNIPGIEPGGQKADPVVFTALVGDFTKVSSGTSFDEGDAIGITALAPINRTNVCYTVKSGALSADDPICWASDQSQTVKFIGVYPFKNGLDPTKSFSFSANGNQSRGTSDSDLLTAVAEAKEGTVQLAFAHRMSKLVITVEGVEATAVSVENVPLSLQADIVAGTYTAGEVPSSVIAFKNSDGKWEAIVAPHKRYAGVIKVTAQDGKTYEFTPSVTDGELGSGKMVTATVTANSAPAEQAVSYTYSIDDWVAGGTIPYTPGAGADTAEHDCYLSVNGTFEKMDYAGNCVWSITRAFTGREYCVVYIDNKFVGRGFEDNYIQFDGEYEAMVTLYYWIAPEYPCKVTISYDMVKEKIRFAFIDSDTWADAGTVTVNGNILEGFGFPAAPNSTVTVPWQKNKYDENVFRAVGPFDYLKNGGVNVGPGHVVLQLGISDEYHDGNLVSFLMSNTGLQYEFWPVDDPGFYYPIFIDGQNVYGSIENNVITFEKGSVHVKYSDYAEITEVNSAVTFTINN